MLTIGCHISTSHGYLAMGKMAHSIGANTFQFFSRNPRGSKSKTINPEDVSALRSFLNEHHFGPLLIHAPYTINPSAADPSLRELSSRIIREDITTYDEHLPNNYYVLHPGNHVGQGSQAGLHLAAETLTAALVPGQNTKILLETMSGKGTELGRSFDELASIIQRTELNEHLGVCLDTCHIFAAGYDIVEHLDQVLQQFDSTIGLNRLFAVHVNDSMMPFGSHKDRHAGVSKGLIGLEGLIRVISHPKLCNLPFVLETPNELEGYAAEISQIKRLLQMQ